MSEINMFEYATRNHLRFQCDRGNLRVEDLWELSLPSLDGIYKTLKATEREANEESLLNVKTTASNELAKKIEIVAYIVRVKLEAVEASSRRQAKKVRKQELLALLAEKQSEELRSKGADEIRKLIEELGED